jgi:hypothetical protein
MTRSNPITFLAGAAAVPLVALAVEAYAQLAGAPVALGSPAEVRSAVRAGTARGLRQAVRFGQSADCCA